MRVLDRERGPASADPGGPWFWRDVLGPFVASRALLLLAAWFGRSFPPDRRYPDAAAVERGWAFVPWRALDVWGRWDTAYYLEIARAGYARPGGIAFFPGYPALVRLVATVTGASPSPRALYLSALAVSNVAALAALATLYRLARELSDDDADAARAVVYLLAFPAGLFLSCAYSESLFLLLGLSAFRFALQRRWALAGAAGLLLALTRPFGVLYVLPLAWLHREASRSGERTSPASAAWLLLVPAGLGAYAAYGWWLTGDPLAVFHVQAGWGRSLSWPWTTLAHPRGFHGYLTRIDGALTVLFVLLGLAALAAFRTRSLGVLLLLSVAPILTSGTLMSATRFLAVAFPAYLVLARLGREPLVDRAYLLLAAGLQALFMATWSGFGWLG